MRTILYFDPGQRGARTHAAPGSRRRAAARDAQSSGTRVQRQDISLLDRRASPRSGRGVALLRHLSPEALSTMSGEVSEICARDRRRSRAGHARRARRAPSGACRASLRARERRNIHETRARRPRLVSRFSRVLAKMDARTITRGSHPSTENTSHMSTRRQNPGRTDRPQSAKPHSRLRSPCTSRTERDGVRRSLHGNRAERRRGARQPKNKSLESSIL
jgi:hypothetical protein